MSVELSMEGSDITVENLQGALGELLDLLAEAAAMSDVDKQTWRISTLRAGSAHVAMTAPDEGAVAALVRDGVDALREAAAIPHGWSRQMVKRVLDLGKRTGSGGATSVGLRLGGPSARARVLDAVVTVNAERALGSATSSYGSVVGTVDRWNEHGRREVGLSRDGGAGSVAAGYPSSLSDRIQRDAIGQRVEAWGTIRRNIVGQITGMTIEDFVVAERQPAISITSLVGVYRAPNGESSLTLDEWLENRHGE